jgi:hypothetical protein
MAQQALFEGLVVDEWDQPVTVKIIGGEAYYVIDDDGFQHHVESERIDRQVLKHFNEMIRGHESLISEGTMRMLGQEDIFTKAAIEKSLENMDEQFDALLQSGMPEEMRAWLGMSGFRIVVSYRGELVRVEQPTAPESGSWH